MSAPWPYWIVLALPVVVAAYLWTRDRALHKRVDDLSSQLEHRAQELEEAHQSLNRLAGRDALTSLADHSTFQEFLRNEWRRALREATSVSVLMVDIDRFSEYNDELGHQAGDECLRAVSQKLTEVIRRPGDLVARYGGEEFAVVMSRTDQQGALRVAHRVCAAIEGLAIAHPESEVSPHVTVSIGVSTSTPAVDSNWEELELVAGANRALEKAKGAGRNRVSADSEDQAPTPPAEAPAT